MTTSKPKKRWLALLLVLLFLGGSYGIYRAVRTPPAVKKVRQLQLELASTDAQSWSAEQRQAKFQEMRGAMQQLSSAQRSTLAAERQQQMQADMERYARMSQAEKVRYLDEQIDRSERLRQQFTTANSGRPPTPPATNTNGRPATGNRGATPEEREKRRKEMLDRTTPEYRALRDQFRKDMENRRKQRGLTPSLAR